MVWETLERPGYFGKRKDEIFRLYDEQFGESNWRIMWQWNKEVIPFAIACQLYEDGYFADSINRQELWEKLTETATNVYDHEPKDIESGLDYTIQQGIATHLQDIAIRRVILRRGWEFKGNQLIQIRSNREYWGQNLSPGRVSFHLPDLIISPHIEKWWDYNSIEDFYQSNKILQVKRILPQQDLYTF